MAEKIDLGYRPRRHQKWLHANMQRFSVIVAHRRLGKCCVASTPIYTDQGFKRISDVDAGDYVYAPDGTLTRVSSVYYGGRKRIYEVHLSKGEVIRTDADHLWYVEDYFSKVTQKDGGYYRRPWRSGGYKTTKELFEEGRTYFIPTADPLKFSKKEVPIDPWLLGYWLGNGENARFNVCVNDRDLHLMEEFDYSSYSSKGNNCSYFHFSGMRPLMKDLGLFHNKHIPKIYLENTFRVRERLLQGIMDSDGTSTKSGVAAFNSNRWELVRDVRFLLATFGISVEIKTHIRQKTGEKEYYLLFAPKNDVNCFTLRRKNDGVNYNERPLRHKITDVVETDTYEDVYCFRVEHPTHLFLVGESLVPTHNTTFALNDMIDDLFRCTYRNPQGIYTAPTYSQAERVVWKMLKEEMENVPGVKKNEQKLRLDIPRKDDWIRIMLMGAENPGTLKGVYIDSMVLDEFGEMTGNIWGEVFRPALSDREGKAKFIGTPKGANKFRDMYLAARKAMKEGSDSWFAAKFKASETGVIPEKELEEARRTMSEEEYLQEFECDFTVGLAGAYYARQMRDAANEGRITRVPFNPSQPVYTGWDLGIDDATAIWFAQEVGKELHLIEYMEFRNQGLEEIVPVLKNRPYTYAEHYLPHDAGARELGSGKTRQETLYNLGLGSRDRLVVLPKHKIEDGIQSVRELLPRCWFDFYNCEDGVECLKSYEKVYDSKEGVYRLKPRHNWASHGADAFRSLATGFRPEEFRTDARFLPREVDDLEYDILGMGE